MPDDQMIEDERPWPPPTISKWVRNQTVGTIRLREELRYWADWAEKADDGAADDLYRSLDA